MDEEQPFSWKGRDGVIYNVATCEDRHLLFFQRMIAERLAERQRQLDLEETPTRVNVIIQERQHRDYLRVSQAVTARGLTPMPLRDPAIIQEARERQQLRAAAQVQGAAPPSTPFSPGVGGGSVGLITPGFFGNLGAGGTHTDLVVSHVTSPNIPPPFPPGKRFVSDTVVPVDAPPGGVETDTPRHIRLPRKKKETS